MPFPVIFYERVGKDYELSHDCGYGDFWWFASFFELQVFDLHVGVEVASDERWHVEGFTQELAAPANEPLAFPFP